MRRSLRNSCTSFCLVACLVACLCAGTVSADEAGATWQVVPRAEHSHVTVNGNDGEWNAWSLGLARDSGAGRRFAATIARQDRNGLSDDELHVSASARAGAWDATATVQISPDPVFLPEWGYHVQVERAAGANRRAGVGYRTLQFNDSRVHLRSAHATFYRGDDELGIEYRVGRNAALDHDIRVLQARAAMIRGRNRFAVYVARGDYLFDALGIPGGDGDGWSANVAYARAITPSTTLRWELGAGGEADTFRQRSVAVSLHYSP